MRAQSFVAPREVSFRVAVQVAERRRETVATMQLRRAAEGPQRVLQAFGKGHKTLAAEHDVTVLEA